MWIKTWNLKLENLKLYTRLCSIAIGCLRPFKWILFFSRSFSRLSNEYYSFPDHFQDYLSEGSERQKAVKGTKFSFRSHLAKVHQSYTFLSFTFYPTRFIITRITTVFHLTVGLQFFAKMENKPFSNRKATFIATVLSTVSIMACVITLPLFYNYMQRVRTMMLSEVVYCKVRG